MHESRPVVDGKFIRLGDHRYLIRGVTYGAFRPNSNGEMFPEMAQIVEDFRLMRMAAINTILTYTVPSKPILDLAFNHQIRVIINIPWFDISRKLELRSTRRALRELIRKKVESCASHPAVLLYCVGKELDPELVRWYGPTKMEGILRDLYYTAKDADPAGLVTYTNFPTTEYLELPFFDVYTFNVYLHDRSSFCSYLARLQHIAGELPLVLTEVGMCSFRHGEEQQAELLGWQFEETIDHGAAGIVVFGWLDSFYGDGEVITDWGFGIVNDKRQPKPSFEVIAEKYQLDSPLDTNYSWPLVSVIVVAYNEEATIEKCLKSLGELRYPAFEVIVIDDGSSDGTLNIMQAFPYRVYSQRNMGVSAARNAGIDKATGEIVAFLDADAWADPDWLAFIVRTMNEQDFAAVGGPNLLPSDDCWTARTIYRAPGGPTHVMLDDHVAEHVPGCNMAFRTAIIRKIGSFDPVFTAAGDDVDVCWRLIEHGYRIGFSAGAVVWHHRRTSIPAYWKQQVGYGISEGLLEKKHPNKYNVLGHALWDGYIYAPNPKFSIGGRNSIYYGLWGSAAFQRVYKRSTGGMLSYLPRTAEWYLLIAFFLVASIIHPWFLFPSGLAVTYSFIYFASCAAAANIQRILPSGKATLPHLLATRVMIFLLHTVEPVARYWGRTRAGLVAWRGIRGDSAICFQQKFKLLPWPVRSAEIYEIIDGEIDKPSVLRTLTSQLKNCGCAVHWNSETASWDMQVRRGLLALATARLHISPHGPGKMSVRFQLNVRPHLMFVVWFFSLLLLGIVAINLGKWSTASFFALATVVPFILAIREVHRIGYTITVYFRRLLDKMKLSGKLT